MQVCNDNTIFCIFPNMFSCFLKIWGDFFLIRRIFSCSNKIKTVCTDTIIFASKHRNSVYSSLNKKEKKRKGKKRKEKKRKEKKRKEKKRKENGKFCRKKKDNLVFACLFSMWADTRDENYNGSLHIAYPYIKEYVPLCCKIPNSHTQNMLYCVLIFIKIFRSLSRPSSVCLSRTLMK